MIRQIINTAPIVNDDDDRLHPPRRDDDVPPLEKSRSNGTASTAQSSTRDRDDEEHVDHAVVAPLHEGRTLPLPTRTGGGIHAAINFLYSRLESGAEAVSDAVASVAPQCVDRCADEEEPEREFGFGPSALELLSESVDECSVATEAVPKTGTAMLAKEDGSEVPRQVRTPSSCGRDVVSEGVASEMPSQDLHCDALPEEAGVEIEAGCDGAGCLVAVFPWASESSDNGRKARRKDDDDYYYGANSIVDADNSICASPLSPGLMSVNETNDSNCHDDFDLANVPTIDDDELLDPTNMSDIDCTKDEYARRLLSQAAVLNAKVQARRAELELKKIRLESLRVEEQMMNYEGMSIDYDDDDDDSAASSYDSLDPALMSGDEDENALLRREESQDTDDTGTMKHALQVFTKFTVKRIPGLGK